jgi:hypothetical protein
MRTPPTLRAAAAALVVTYAAPLLADPTSPPTKLECNDAHTQAQPLRRAGQLRAARRELRTCAAPACPVIVRDECAQWLDEVGRAIPTLVLEARDQDGNDRSDVRVTLDGQPLLERLDGNAIEVDPGEHDLVFEAEGVAPVARHVVIAAGEKERHERATLEVPRSVIVPPPPAAPLPVEPPPAPPPEIASAPAPAPHVEPPPRTSTESGSVALCTLGLGTAGVGLLVGSIAGLVSMAQVATIKSQCDGNSCPRSLASNGSTAATLGNVSNVAFIAAGAGLLLGLLTIPHSSSSSSAGGVRFAVGPGSFVAQGSF